MNNIETQEQWNELETTLPLVLTNIIIEYVPLIEFTWNPFGVVRGRSRKARKFRARAKEKYGSWNTAVSWRGPLTRGHWWLESRCDLWMKRDILEKYKFYQSVKDMEASQLQQFMYDPYEFIAIFNESFQNYKQIPFATMARIAESQCNKGLKRYINPFPLNEKYIYWTDDLYYIRGNYAYSEIDLENIWILKCDKQAFLDELQYVTQVISTHPIYNHAFFSS